jgi:phosphotransferase system IIB component
MGVIVKMSDVLRWCLIGVSATVALLIIIVLAVVVRKKSKFKENTEFPELLEALGGAENISNISLNGSRISLNFDSKKAVDKELIKENGVETIVVANKKITLVIGKKASIIYKYLQESIR